jgi:hypothetical protein
LFSKTGDLDPCPWLLRSPETETFDLLEVEGNWDLWAGDITKTEVTVVCNECTNTYDCNLNGVCNHSSKKCECNGNDQESVQYLGEPFVALFFLSQCLVQKSQAFFISISQGMHCEVKLPSECLTILGEGMLYILCFVSSFLQLICFACDPLQLATKNGQCQRVLSWLYQISCSNSIAARSITMLAVSQKILNQMRVMVSFGVFWEPVVSAMRLGFLKWSKVVLIFSSTDRFNMRLSHFYYVSFSEYWDWQAYNYHGNHVHLCKNYAFVHFFAEHTYPF